MRNTKTGFKLLLEYMVLNIKFIQQEYFPAVFTITTFLVPCVTWTQEPLRWWFQVQTCVPRVGRASTKDTWWLNTIVITVQCTILSAGFSNENPALCKQINFMLGFEWIYYVFGMFVRIIYIVEFLDRRSVNLRSARTTSELIRTQKCAIKLSPGVSGVSYMSMGKKEMSK